MTSQNLKSQFSWAGDIERESPQLDIRHSDLIVIIIYDS